MSIINDALKKAQASLNKRTYKDITKSYQKIETLNEKPKNKPAPLQPSSAVPQIKRRPESQQRNEEPQNMTIWVGTSAITACIILTGLYYIIKPSAEQNTTVKISPIVVTQSTMEQTAQPIRPQPPQRISRPFIPKQDNLILSGISIIAGRKVAIINDKIYELGESVKGRKIVDIRRKEVDLLENGKILTIDVRGKR